MGCTDVSANNFNPEATVNDGSCTYNSASVSSVNSWPLPEAIHETSGLILWNDKIWTHNDDTDVNLYALDTNDIDSYSTFPLTSCMNKDWEEIAQDSAYIYIGDFGNNVSGNRTDIKILRVEKSSLLENNPVIDTINFSYATQTDFSPAESNQTDFDCEAFVISTDSIYLFTKEWVSRKSTIYSLPKTPGTYSANYISSYNVNGLITGSTYLEEKNLIALSGYSLMLEPFIILLYDFQYPDFFRGNKRKLSLNLPYTQVEGIATEDGINYFVSNETFIGGAINSPAKLNLFNLSDYLTEYLAGAFSLSIPNPLIIEEFNIYPNPVTDILNFTMKSANFSNAKLTLYNSFGQIIDSYAIDSEETTINVSNYTSGLYYGVISSEGSDITHTKFIKL